MRKISVVSMISLDGVLQAPGGPGEDTSGGFTYGGWSAPYGDKVIGEVMQQLMQPSDLLLGRKTYDIWSAYWPDHTEFWPSINDVPKYVMSTTETTSDWAHTSFLKDVEALQRLKASAGSDLQVWGSGQLIQTLFEHDLVDELWLQIHPLTLGSGKKLFATGTIPAAFTLIDSKVSTTGVILAQYERGGDVKTGTIDA